MEHVKSLAGLLQGPRCGSWKQVFLVRRLYVEGTVEERILQMARKPQAMAPVYAAGAGGRSSPIF